jgi:hypothetical protein
VLSLNLADVGRLIDLPAMSTSSNSSSSRDFTDHLNVQYVLQLFICKA